MRRRRKARIDFMIGNWKGLDIFAIRSVRFDFSKLSLISCRFLLTFSTLYEWRQDASDYTLLSVTFRNNKTVHYIV